MDARRISDNRLVYIKRVRTGGSEVKIATMLVAAPLDKDPRNHCVPILDVFQDDQDEDISYMIMPFLRPIIRPQFDYVENVVDFVNQVLEVRQTLLSELLRLTDFRAWYSCMNTASLTGMQPTCLIGKEES